MVTLGCDVCGLPVEVAGYVRRVLCATCLDCGFVTEAKPDVATADEKCDGCSGLFPRAQLTVRHVMNTGGMLPPQFCHECLERTAKEMVERTDGDCATFGETELLCTRIAALELLVLRLVQRVELEHPSFLTPDERKLLTEEPR